MTNIRRNTALTLVLLLSTLSLMMIESTLAQLLPKPSVPEFTVILADHSYDVPNSTTTSIDQYTGKTITVTTPGYHVENRTIDITITNQPFVPENSLYNFFTNLYYDIRYKGHFGNSWTELYAYNGDECNLPQQSTSAYTIISTSIPQQGNSSDAIMIDFQVQAVNGTNHAIPPGINTPFGYWTYITSGWSNIETLNTADGSVSVSASVSPAPSPTMTPTITQTSTPAPSPTVPEHSYLAILPLLASMFAITIFLKHHQVKKT
jgi:hypothetical protein